MADYIYTMEIRLTPDQLKGVNLVQEIARAAGITLYLTGGAIRDIISGFTIRDLDFTVQGNPLKLLKDFEKGGARVTAVEEDVRTIFLALAGNARAESRMGAPEAFEKTGKAADRLAGDHPRRFAPPRLHHQRDGALAQRGLARTSARSVQWHRRSGNQSYSHP